MDQFPQLTEGRITHYVAFNGRHLAAMVIGVANRDVGLVDLVVFTNMPNAAGNKNFGTQFHQDVIYSPDPEPRSWHWAQGCEAHREGSHSA